MLKGVRRSDALSNGDKEPLSRQRASPEVKIIATQQLKYKNQGRRPMCEVKTTIFNDNDTSGQTKKLKQGCKRGCEEVRNPLTKLTSFSFSRATESPPTHTTPRNRLRKTMKAFCTKGERSRKERFVPGAVEAARRRRRARGREVQARRTGRASGCATEAL